MIQRIGLSSISFGATQIKSARDAYQDKINANIDLAKKQNDTVLNPDKNTDEQKTKEQDKKLDVVA